MRPILDAVPRSFRLPLAATLAVAVAWLPMPSGYYVLLGLFLCVSCVYYLSETSRLKDWQKWTLIGLIIVHNPVVPVPLGDQTVWFAVEVATVILFWMVARRARVGW